MWKVYGRCISFVKEMCAVASIKSHDDYVLKYKEVEKNGI